MKVLLKEGADAATSETILVLPQLGGSTFETLSGDAVSKGVVTEVDAKAVTSAVNTGATARRDEFVTAKEFMKDVRWLNKALGEYELGSKVGLRPTPSGYQLDDSEATRVNRAEGLAKGDTIAVGPTISPRAFTNARGRVVSIKGDKVLVDLDAGDRDRVRRLTGKDVAERATFPLACVEKVS